MLTELGAADFSIVGARPIAGKNGDRQVAALGTDGLEFSGEHHSAIRAPVQGVYGAVVAG